MLVVVLFSLLAIANGQSIQVTTVEGVIEGYEATEGNYYTFHGIPYAMSRVNLDMFKPSTPATAFPGVFHAYDSGIECARPTPDGMVGIVNCLVLNVFTSNVTASKPVIVWLNGEESNPTVSSQYSYNRLINEDLVVVTLNYRLSVFGFLCLLTEQHPGNAGLKDIILGLQWVQRNIAVFGGDPNNVVLMGHGSAAAMVDLITLTTQSENLVHKAIAFSGSSMAPWAISRDPIGAAVTLNRVTGGLLQSIDDVAVFLSYRTLNEISDALNQFKYTNNTPMFAPCLEDPSLEGAILTDSPINLLRSSTSHKDIPYIAGFVTNEGTQRASEAVDDGWLEQMQNNFTEFLPVDLNFGETLEARAASIRNHYFGNGAIGINSGESYLRYHGDTMVVVPMIRGVRERAQSSDSDVWLLEFGFIGSTTSDWNHAFPLNGVRHGSILNYIFDFGLIHLFDGYVAEAIVEKISNFAHLGFPEYAGYRYWRPFEHQTPNYMAYTGNIQIQVFTQTMLVNPQQGTMTFWDPLYNTYYESPSSAAGLTGLLSVVLFSLMLLIMA